jgi:hypothetical protein
VVVARVAGNDAMVDGAGAVAERTDTSATYKLNNNWAGAELTVSFGSELGGKLTVIGLGLPIVESTRGTMSLTEASVAGPRASEADLRRGGDINQRCPRHWRPRMNLPQA